MGFSSLSDSDISLSLFVDILNAAYAYPLLVVYIEVLLLAENPFPTFLHELSMLG